MATVSAFRVGHCTHPSCMVLKGSGLKSACFPSRAFLIETRAGFMLWDTGYSQHFFDASRTGFYRLYPWVTPVQFDASESLVGQLKAAGVAAKEVRTVVLSHYHADHMAGLLDFPHAKVLGSQAAWLAVRHLRGFAAVRQAFLPGLVPSDIETRLSFVEHLPTAALPAALAPFTQGWDVTGTGEFIIVPLPGHTLGHLGAFVATPQGWVLLASDAAWLSEGYRSLRGPSELSFILQHNRRDYYRTLGKLHALHQSGQARIELCHEEPAP
jgi:glyoxylase-like metal-dependent hydrolase (beta-lactamase superfamily II)